MVRVFECTHDRNAGHQGSLHEAEVEAVTLEEIKRVAAKYFQAQPYVLATVRPAENHEPTKKK